MKRGHSNRVRGALPAARRVRAALAPWLPQADVAELLQVSRREVDRCELTGLAKLWLALQPERTEELR